MNWIKEAVNDLKAYNERKVGIDNIKEQIKILEEQYVSLKGISNGTPVMGGSSKQEDAWINNIAKRERLKLTLEPCEKLIGIIDNALNSLSDDDRYILDTFYINRPYDYLDKLCERFNIERSRIYELKDRALKNFTISMYGIIDL